MTEFRKGDVCSLEVVVECVASNGDVLISHPDCQVDEAAAWVTPKHLTLIRRASVDLETCDLPVEVIAPGGYPATMVHRENGWAFLRWPRGGYDTCKVSVLRHADAPAPAAPPERIRVAQDAEGFWTCREATSGSPEYIRADLSPAPAAEASPIGWIYFSPDAGTEFAANHPIESGECTDAENIRAATDEVLRDELVQAWRDLKGVERMLAEAQDRAADAGEVERLRSTLRLIDARVKGDFDNPLLIGFGPLGAALDDIERIVTEALASTATSCPPGHILIGGRAVPEPMREAPEIGTVYWVPLGQVDSEAKALLCRWRNDGFDRAFLLGGLCHSTKAAARAHVEALVALSNQKGV